MGIRHSKKCEVLQDIKELVKTEKIVLFIEKQSKSSFEAIQICKRFLLKPFLIDIDSEPARGPIIQALFQLSGNMKCPLVFVNGVFFGSIKELKASVKTGELALLLKKHQIPYQEVNEIQKLDLGL